MTESNQTADPRIEHARQVLAGYDRGRWTAEVNLIGHLAGAVRQLLEVIGEQRGADLTDVQREVLAHAIADAVAWCTDEDFCGGCEQSPTGVCATHQDELDQRDAYVKLARQLGIEVQR